MGEGRFRVLVEQLAGHHEVTRDEVGGGLVEGDQFPTDIGSQFFCFDISRQLRAVISGLGLVGGLCRTGPARSGHPWGAGALAPALLITTTLIAGTPGS